MKKIKYLIIDDELSNRKLIQKLITEIQTEFEILGEAKNINEAFELINLLKPDVIFLDIKMPGGSGIELLEMFKELFFEVVFISGFDNYAIKAFEFNALDYVLKPINFEKFSKTLKKVKNKFESREIEGGYLKSIVDSYDSKKSILSKIPIHKGKNVRLIRLEEIIYAKAIEGYTIFKLTSNEKVSSSKQLGDFDFIFEKCSFFIKINKGTIINANFVEIYSKGMECEITLNEGTIFEISRRKKSEVLQYLSNFTKPQVY